MAGGEDEKVKSPPDGGPVQSDSDHGYQRDDRQNGRQTVEDPFTAWHMDFQIVHCMVDTVQTAPQRQDDHQEDEHAANKAARKGQHALIA